LLGASKTCVRYCVRLVSNPDYSGSFFLTRMILVLLVTSKTLKNLLLSTLQIVALSIYCGFCQVRAKAIKYIISIPTNNRSSCEMNLTANLARSYTASLLRSFPTPGFSDIGLPYDIQIVLALRIFDPQVDCECFRWLHALYHSDM
jgi:hypothetical protein